MFLTKTDTNHTFNSPHLALESHSECMDISILQKPTAGRIWTPLSPHNKKSSIHLWVKPQLVMSNGNGYRFTSLETGRQSEKPVIGKFLSFYYAFIYW